MKARKLLWLVSLSCLMLFAVGCQLMHQSPTDPNQIVVDPNLISAVEMAGRTVQSVGAILGHIELVGLGGLVVAIALGLKKLSQKKPEGTNSNG